LIWTAETKIIAIFIQILQSIENQFINI